MAKKKEPIVETKFEFPEETAVNDFAQAQEETDREKEIQARVDAAVEAALKQAATVNTKDSGSKTSSLTKEDVTDLLAKILPATIMAMEQAKTLSLHDATLKAMKAKTNLEEKCSICRQSVGDGKARGCGGPWKRDKQGNYIMETDKVTGEEKRIEDPHQFHDKMAVFPSDPIAEAQFDGVFINGAHYRSQGPGHLIWVPRNNDIAAMLVRFTEDQRIQATGRKRAMKSGTLSGNGQHNVTGPTFT